MPISGYFDIPFAQGGDLNTIPDATQPSGTVSYEQGFPVGYSTPVSSGGFNVPRTSINQAFNDVTTAMQYFQQGNAAAFITSAMNGGTAYSYPEYAIVSHGGVTYVSLANSNTDTPPSSKWQVLTSLGNSGVVGDSRNLVIAQASTVTATVTADEVIVETALGGTTTKISSFSVTLNTASTGLNGMDTGSPPSSGYLWVYAVTGPGETPGVLAQTASGTPPSIYGGSHMPSGYTQSALIGILPTNSSAQFPGFYQIARELFYSPGIAFLSSATGQSSLTSASLASVPVGARMVSGSLESQTGNAGGTEPPEVSSDSSGNITQKGTGFAGIVTNLRPVVNFRLLPILTAQTIWWRTADTTASSVNAFVSSYTF
ncbi:hypothetical protein [Fimbriiglobus ruber]|uniref:Phage tail fiber protein n=1 Tax=Fimbriiglobus ruber TaxID=1908690 RepID=A0A225EGW9_9BACT|nr:hypothetical protein [Fimbriiglobus ruber]OWK47545.1 Phage tail fiber protein [Fimbriiglobus ruber]